MPHPSPDGSQRRKRHLELDIATLRRGLLAQTTSPGADRVVMASPSLVKTDNAEDHNSKRQMNDVESCWGQLERTYERFPIADETGLTFPAGGRASDLNL